MSENCNVSIVDGMPESWNATVNLLASIGIAANTYISAEEFLQSGNDSKPGCVLTELLLPRMSGLELLEKLALNPFRPASIVVTDHATIATAIRSLQLGSLTLLEKPCNDLAVLNTIREAIKLDAITRQASIERANAIKAIEELSTGECNVLRLLMNGFLNKQIAKRLDIAMRTVESRRQRIMRKLGVASLPQLITKVVQAEYDPMAKPYGFSEIRPYMDKEKCCG